jgi:FkbM family methyltransferase
MDWRGQSAQRHVSRLVKAVSRLGIRNGLQVYYPYVLHRLVRARRWTKRKMVIRSISHPVWMRPGVSDWIVLERIFFDREYDPSSAVHSAAMHRLEQAIAAGNERPLIIDCGANIGLSAIWFAEHFTRSTVVAVEPERENFEILALNAAAFPNIVAINAAVSNSLSRVLLQNDTHAPWAWQTVESDEGQVDSVTISSLLARFGAHRPFIIKIDIEGFETVALESGAAWVDELPVMIFEMHDWLRPWSGSGHAFFSLLSRRKRDYLVKGENIFALLSDAMSGP